MGHPGTAHTLYLDLCLFAGRKIKAGTCICRHELLLGMINQHNAANISK
jgi:hypothetical protein